MIIDQAGPLLQQLEAAAEQKSARFTAVLKLVKEEDVCRGQEVVEGTKAACAACYSIGYRDGKVGPELTKIGRIRDDRVAGIDSLSQCLVRAKL